MDDFEQWQRTLVKQLASKSVDNIKAKSMAYRHDNWISMPDQNALEPFILSVTAGEMFQVFTYYYFFFFCQLWIALCTYEAKTKHAQLNETEKKNEQKKKKEDKIKK